jgi:hypothetical protein
MSDFRQGPFCRCRGDRAQGNGRSYENDEIDAVYLIYNEFKSVIAQKLMVTKLLPVAVVEQRRARRITFTSNRPRSCSVLLPKYVETGILRAMLESAASEHAARMTAMDAASTNAADVIEGLTLHLNRVRQASITKRNHRGRQRRCRFGLNRSHSNYVHYRRNCRRQNHPGRWSRRRRPVPEKRRFLSFTPPSGSPGRLQRARPDRHHCRSRAAHRRRPRANHRAAAHRRSGARHEG